MCTNIVVDYFMWSQKPKEDSIFPVHRISPVARKFTFEFVGSQAGIEGVFSEPLIFSSRKPLDLFRESKICGILAAEVVIFDRSRKCDLYWRIAFAKKQSGIRFGSRVCAASRVSGAPCG